MPRSGCSVLHGVNPNFKKIVCDKVLAVTCNCNTKKLATMVILRMAIPKNTRYPFRSLSNIYDGDFTAKKINLN